MNTDNKYAVGIDIGTDSVKVVVGREEDRGQSNLGPRFTIIGAGRAKTVGMRKGVAVNIEGLAQSLDKALNDAERMSGYQISSATVSINGSHIVGLSSQGVIAVGNGQIGDEEIARVREAAEVVQLPANREILDTTPRSYKLDSQDNIRDPFGMTGIRLEVDTYMITALTPHLRNLEQVLEMTEIRANRILPASLAAAHISLTDQQRENGVVSVDIGASTTSVAVYEEGDIIHMAVLPMGSANITNDLAIGLKTDLDVAEAVKVHHAVAAPELRRGAEEKIAVKVGGREYVFDTEILDNVVEARLEELFELINKELKKIKKFANLPGGAVISGGGARLRGIADYAREIMQMNAVLGKTAKYDGMADKVAGPEFATALGLMSIDAEFAPVQNGKRGGFGLSGLGGLFAKFGKK